MKRILAGSCFILIVANGFGQLTDTLAWASGALLKAGWHRAELPQVPFQFNGRFEVTIRKERIGQTRHNHLAAYAQWLGGQSFVADSVADRCKPLAQLYFDCYELESRKLQETINLPNVFIEEEVIASEQRVRGRISTLRMMTNDGRYTEQFSYWRKWMDSALVATPRLYPPEWETGNFELGFDVGAGTIAYNGDLSQYFGNMTGWGIGAGFRVKRFAFEYRTIHCNVHSLQAFTIGDFKFSDTNRLLLNQATWSLGMQLIQQPRWAVIPYIGMSTFRVINRDEPKGSLYHKGRVSVNAEAGILTEWRFNAFYQGNQSQFAWKLIFKAGYAPVNYLKTVSGGALKIQIGIGYTLKSVINTRFES